MLRLILIEITSIKRLVIISFKSLMYKINRLDNKADFTVSRGREKRVDCNTDLCLYAIRIFLP